MFEIFKIKKSLKKLKDIPPRSGFLTSLRSKLDVYTDNNPVRKSADERLYITEGSNPLLIILNKFKTMPISIIFALIMTLSGGGAAFASQDSLPGETLYPIKIFTENVRSVVARSPESKAKLEVKFASERVAEVKELLAEKGVEPKGLDKALERFEINIKRASALLEGEEGNGDISELKDMIKELKEEKKQLREELKAQRKALKDEMVDDESDDEEEDEEDNGIEGLDKVDEAKERPE